MVGPPALAALGFTPAQYAWLAAAWALFFLAPALAVRAHARRRGRPWGRWFALTLVASALGVLEYWEDAAVTRRRARRAPRAVEPGDDRRGP